MEDFVAWNPAKHGTFSMRSAYQVEWEFQYRQKIQPTSSSSNQVDVWDSVWNLKCPAKIKIFIWRALHSAIPCRAILAAKHIKVKSHCPPCNKGVDNIIHLLFQCEKAEEVWKMMGVYDVIKKACKVNRSEEVVLEQLLSLQDSDVHILGLPNLRETIAATAWYLWYEQRQLIHGGQTQTTTQILLAVKSFTTNYVIACSPKAKRRSTLG
jgi:hypothetical protein